MRITAPGALIAIGLVAVLTPTPAAASCCDHEKSACCQQHSQPCCKEQGDQAAMSVLLPTLDNEAPARETLVVWFQRPVKVTDRILFGKYVIEHDNDRQARGEPCTHIYAANNTIIPVVAFHCTHLKRARAESPTVFLRSLGEVNGMQALVSFQFSGESAAHGVPASR